MENRDVSLSMRYMPVFVRTTTGLSDEMPAGTSTASEAGRTGFADSVSSSAMQMLFDSSIPEDALIVTSWVSSESATLEALADGTTTTSQIPISMTISTGCSPKEAVH